MKWIGKLICSIVIIFCAQKANGQAYNKFLKTRGEWVLTYKGDTGSIRLFDQEILPEVSDSESGKTIEYYGFNLEITRTTKESSPLANVINYEKLYEKKGETDNDLIKEWADIHRLLMPAFSIKTINGLKFVHIDLSEHDAKYPGKHVHIANRSVIKIRLEKERVWLIGYNELDPVIRVIPKGARTLFLPLSDLRVEEPINDITRYEELKSENGLVILKDINNPGKYFKSGPDYRPDPLSKKNYKLENGKTLTYQVDKWTELDAASFPVPLWLIILGGALVLIGLVLLFLLKIKKVHYVRHTIQRDDTLEFLKEKYTVLGVEVQKRRIKELNLDLLENFDPKTDKDRVISKKNPDALGKILIIPIWKRTYKKRRREPVNENQFRKTVDEISERSTSTNYSPDLSEGSEILERLKNIELKLGAIFENDPQEDIRAFQNQNTTLTANNRELERKLKDLQSEKDELQKDKNRFENLADSRSEELSQSKESRESLKQELISLEETQEKVKSKLKTFRQRVLLFSDEGKKFADNRVQLLESGINTWEELSLIFQESLRSQQFERESHSLGQILHRKELLDALVVASSSIKQLSYLGQTGVWTDINHVRKLRQEKDESSRLKFIEKSLIQDAIAPFLTKLIVCLEEARSLENTLARKNDLINRIAEVGTRLHEIRKQAEEFAGIAIDYVPLFSSVSGHSQVRAIERQPGVLYAHLALDKNHILEIENYGYRAAGHSTLTTVIIKR